MSNIILEKINKIEDEIIKINNKICEIEIEIKEINELFAEYNTESWLVAKTENNIPIKWKKYNVYSIEEIKDKENKYQDEKKKYQDEKIKYIDMISTLYSKMENIKSTDEDIAISLENISIKDNTVLITNQHQESASTFVQKGAKKPEGFGYLPTTYTKYDPTYYNENSLTNLLIPTTEEINQASLLLKMNGEKENLSCKGEEEGIVALFESLLSASDGWIINKRKSFKDNKISYGIASSKSYNDFCIKFDDEMYSMLEVKGADGSVLDAVCQAAISATHIALRLLSIGIPSKDCIIPVIGSNGLVIIFGATIVLNNSYPTYIPISKQLDIIDENESKIIAAYFSKISNHCKKLNDMKVPINKVKEFKQIELLLNSEYYIKKYDIDVYSRGIGIFCYDKNKLNVDYGLNHMVQVYNLLYKNEKSRKYVEFPLSIRTPDKSSEGNYMIIYRNLVLLGYKTGYPNRLNITVELWECFKNALILAVNTIHEAGVIHLDLYPSNIMWKCDNNIYEIKIIDWDCAHCLYENNFHVNVYNSLVDFFERLDSDYEPVFDISHDQLYLNVLNLSITNDNNNNWIDLSSTDIKIMNKAFYSLFKEYLKMNKNK